MFRALGEGLGLRPRRFKEALRERGLLEDDPRLASLFAQLARVPREHLLGASEVRDISGPNMLLLERAMRRDLVIPDFDTFCQTVDGIFDAAAEDESGEIANYIPQLSRMDPSHHGMALCTIDGQRYGRGSHRVPFSLQSVMKPVNYCMALEEQGEEVVHRHIGREPSGFGFNELRLNPDGLPHNPMVNAGAIMACALIRPKGGLVQRFEAVMDTWARLSGGKRPGFNNAVYVSERQSADRNFALAYFMREKGAFPEGSSLMETLDFYFQCCSLEVNSEHISIAAATLANGGVCPLTGERVMEASTVRHCLSLMSTCGMYDFSGEFAFHIGLPAKSGVSGAIMVVVPNVMGVGLFSPRLDSLGNSVRGLRFCEGLVSTFPFHRYDNLSGLSGKADPRVPIGKGTRAEAERVVWAAKRGDPDAKATQETIQTLAIYIAGGEGGVSAEELAAMETALSRLTVEPLVLETLRERAKEAPTQGEVEALLLRVRDGFDDTLKALILRACLLVAWVDGPMTDVEESRMREVSSALGVPWEAVMALGRRDQEEDEGLRALW